MVWNEQMNNDVHIIIAADENQKKKKKHAEFKEHIMSWP